MSCIKVTQPGLNSQPFNAQALLLSQHHSDMSSVYTLMRENHTEPGNLLPRKASNRALLPPQAITKFTPMSASPHKQLSGQSHTDRTAARRAPPNVWFKHSNGGGVGGCVPCVCVCTCDVVLTCVCTRVEESSIFPRTLLRQCLSVNLELTSLTDWHSLTDWQPENPRPLLRLPPGDGVTDKHH